jgi:uncharacterized protein YhdP
MTLSHFNHLLSKAFRWFLWVVVMIMTLTLILSACIFFTLLIAEHDGKLDKWVHEGTGWEMQYHDMHIGINAWNPSIVIDGVVVTDSKNPRVQFKLDRFEVDLAVWPTLFKREPVTSQIEVSGLRLDAKEISDTQWSINNMLVGGVSSNSDLSQLLVKLLLDQKKINIHDLYFHVDLLNSHDYTFTPVNLLWYGTAHKVKLSTGMQNVPNSQFVLSAQFVPAPEVMDYNAWKINFNGSISASDFSPLLVGHSLYQLKILSGGGELDFNGLFDQGDLSQLQVGVSLNNLNLTHTDAAPINITKVDEQVFWHSFGKGKGWSLRIQPVSGAASALGVDGAGVAVVTYHPQDLVHTWVISADDVDLGILGQWVDFGFTSNQEIAKVWNVLNPEGTVETLQVTAGASSGTVSFAGRNLTVDPSVMFPHGWPPSVVKLTSTWQETKNKKNWLVTLNSLMLQNDHLTFNAQGALKIPVADPSNPYLDLRASLQAQNLDQVASYYIPQNFQHLAGWLNQGLVKLPSVNANLVWQGQLRDMPYADQAHPGLFHLEVDTTNAAIQPWMNWPLISNLNAKLLFNNQRFTIDADGAQTQGITLHKVHFEMKDMRPLLLAPIVITGSANPTGAQALNYFGSMPLLSQRLQSIVKNNLQLTGVVPLLLNITIPLHQAPGQAPVIASGSVTFNANTLTRVDDGQTTWAFKNIIGALNFQNAYLSSSDFSFMFKDLLCSLQVIQSPANNLHLLVPELKLYGQTFSNVNVFIQPAPDNDPAPVKNPMVTLVLNDADAVGTVILNPQGNIQASFDKWIITPFTTATKTASPNSSLVGVTTVDTEDALPSDYLAHMGALLAKIPPLAITVKQFAYGLDPMGSLFLQSNPMSDGILIHRLTVGDDDAKVDLAGSIVTHNKSDEVSAAGTLSGDNFGKALTQLGYPGILDAGSGTIKFQFNWFGRVLHPEWTTFQGSANFDVGGGTFLTVDTGIAQIFGLLSVNTVFSTVSFNFKNIFQGGLAFNTIKGDYVIHNGVAHTDNLAITGPTADVHVKGDMDVPNNTIDQVLTIKPQLGMSATLAATFIGGPIVGAATFVANALISNVVLRNVGFSYHVTGPLSSPKAESLPSNDQPTSTSVPLAPLAKPSTIPDAQIPLVPLVPPKGVQ